MESYHLRSSTCRIAEPSLGIPHPAFRESKPLLSYSDFQISNGMGGTAEIEAAEIINSTLFSYLFFSYNYFLIMMD